MGLSLSAAAAVLFIATAIVFGTMIGALDHAQGSILDAQRQSAARAASTEGAGIAVISVDRENGNVSLNNTGLVTLDIRSIDVLLNGSLSNGHVRYLNITKHPGTNLWLPGETLEIKFDRSLEMTAIKVVAGNGASAYA